MIVKLTNDFYVAYDWRDVFRLCAFAFIASTALALGLVAPRLRNPARLMPWVWAWAGIGFAVACLPFSVEWWFNRIVLAVGVLITARTLGMRVRRMEER